MVRDQALIEIDIKRLSEIQPESVFEYMKTSKSGLSNEEADARILLYGENKVKSQKSFNPLQRFARQLVNIMALMLWAASILALVSKTPLLSYVIWFIIIVNAAFSFVQEYKADKALQALAKMIPSNVKVYRDGEIMVLSADKLVPGDVVFLTAGDKVPADMRIVSSDDLMVDNSMLTGESLAVDRDAQPNALKEQPITDSPNFLFAGTSVTGGDATGVVFATGEDSQIGNITQTSAQIVKSRSTLELQIQKITKTLMIISVTLGILAFMISTFVTGININAAAIFAIGIIVANVPEGLMPTVSLSLALGVERMAKKNALVRKQSAVETLGSTTVICTDKTGTLTQNAMFAKKIWTPDGTAEITGEGYEKEGSVKITAEKSEDTLERLFQAATICSDTVLITDKENPSKWKIVGDPTEGAILIAAQKAGITSELVEENFKLVKTIPFSSDTKTMSVIASSRHGISFQFTKGDPAKVIDSCSRVFKAGEAVELAPGEREKIHDSNDELASEGYRLLAVAYSDQPQGYDPNLQDMTLLGLVAMYDPPREGVTEAISDCRRAGIKVTVFTGDYSLTAAAIARQIGIVQERYVSISGSELEGFSDEELSRKIATEDPIIFSRTTPKDKLRIVEAYQKLGQVVASTGDGINDVLALRKADIGIAMGENGSDAAIESSDIVLLDNNFITIVEAIKEGRAIYDNIQKFITYILASNIPEVVPFLAMGIFNIPLAITVLLVLSIDLGTDLIPALSLGKEEPDESVLYEPPRKLSENILNRKVLLRSYGFLGIIEAAMMFVVYFLTWSSFGYSFSDIRSFTADIANGNASREVMYAYKYAITLSFGAVVAAQIGNVLECRSSWLSFTKTLNKKNTLMIWGIVAEVVLFLLIAYVPFIQALFGTTAPKVSELPLLLICPLALICLEEVRKWILRRKSQKA